MRVQRMVYLHVCPCLVFNENSISTTRWFIEHFITSIFQCFKTNTTTTRGQVLPRDCGRRGVGERENNIIRVPIYFDYLATLYRTIEIKFN